MSNKDFNSQEKMTDLLAQLQSVGVPLDKPRDEPETIEILKEKSRLSKDTLNTVGDVAFAAWPDWDDIWTKIW